MLGYITKRIIIAMAVIFAVSSLTFFMLSVIPGDTAVTIIQKIFVGDPMYNPTQQEIETTQKMFKLDQPLWVQYLRWIDRALHGDFGVSYTNKRPVFVEILERLPATAILAISATLLSLLISIPLGVICAIKQNYFIDSVCMAFSTFFIAMPGFWFALILILIFSLKLNLLPVAGYGDFMHLILPTVTLSMGMAAVTMRLTRTSMLEVLRLEYVTTAKSKGLSDKIILLRHVLKNALIPVVTNVGLQMGYLLGGTVIVETIFGWPGIGKLLADSIDVRDIPMIQGGAVFMAIVFSVVNLLVDLSYRFLDPKVRYEGGE
jgi:peptide/nickel transport system permease protein